MGKFIKGLVPLIILAGGLIAGAWFFNNPDEAQKRPRPEAQALLVETGQAEAGTYPAYVEAMGQVKPALEVALKPQVGGEIIAAESEFIPGGHFREGDIILDIDPADYELVVQKQEAVLAQAQADYDLEMGRQSVAKDELKILERTTGRKPDSPDLALRRPQLAQAQAELEKARSDLETAKLALQRTAVRAPFNALITARNATTGDTVSAGATLGTAVSTDEYWVEISVPVHDLRWLEIPQRAGEAGSPARVVLDGGRGERQGQLMRLTGTLDTASRLATLLVSVPDPLGLAGGDKPPLILGDYVQVTLEGKSLADLVRVPLTWVRDGNIVWIKEDGRLVYKQVRVVYEDRDYAYIAEGVTGGDNIVISDIAVPVEGMKVRTKDETSTQAPEKQGKNEE